ncbi:MAG TPA: hypothetical protein DEA08_34340 [Planctomycetes bacterium]|nr:hypothetical protein [Planctomycetota bacterium]
MINTPIKPFTRLALGLLSVVLMLGFYGWEVHQQKLKNPRDTSMPNLTQLREGVHDIVKLNERTGERWLVEDAKASLTRLSLGFLVGLAGAIVIGFAMGVWAPAEAFLLPPITLTNKLNPIAMLAVFFVLFGIETKMFVAIIAFVVMPSLAITIHLAAKSDVPEELIHKAYTLGASHAEVIWDVVFKQVQPKLIEGIRLQLGPALVILVAAELWVADVGFGYRIRLQSKLAHMNVVFVYVTLLAVMGYLADLGLRKLLEWRYPYYTRAEEEEAFGPWATFKALLGNEEPDSDQPPVKPVRAGEAA